jgi:transposase InsO family protein
MAASTVQAILRAEGLGRLDRGDRATDREPVHRYQRDRPGELVHVDVKKVSAIPVGGGWRIHGRGNAPAGDHSGAGYRYIHTALDDRTRIVYSEIHNDEQSTTAAGFWVRAVTWFAGLGITVERVLSDNGSCYRSRLWHQTCAQLGVKVKKTRPRRPQTNGKVERFHRILLEEWAYIRPWTSETQRAAGYRRFIHFYNHHRSHGALGWATPMNTLNHLTEDNLPAEHS